MESCFDRWKPLLKLLINSFVYGEVEREGEYDLKANNNGGTKWGFIDFCSLLKFTCKKNVLQLTAVHKI